MHGQKELYERIHDEYYRQLHDEVAEAYLAEFVYGPMLGLVPDDTRTVLELASGSGPLSAWLRMRRPELEFMGSDISERACADYERINNAPCIFADLTKPTQFPRQFDSVIVGGGIHHLVTDLDTAMANIAGALKPGGTIIMVEPNADYFLEPIRRIWYKLDRQYFEAKSEHALSHGRLTKRYASLFSLDHIEYGGGPSIYLLLHSMFFRLPLSVKSHVAPAAMVAERLYAHLPSLTAS
jgi:SAM-dependent methyltransferase